jgi:hypothetical protein
VHEVCKLFYCLHHLHCSEVNAPEHYTILLRRFHIYLQRRLAVDLYRKVNDVSTLHQTVRRSVCPASSDINPDRRAPPHNLIIHRTEGRFFCDILNQAFTQQTESLFALTTKHRIVDADQQRGIVRKRLRHGDSFAAELLLGISEV